MQNKNLFAMSTMLVLLLPVCAASTLKVTLHRSIILFFALFFTTVTVLAEDIPTRFGLLKIDDENRLLFKKRPLNPKIQGNNSLSAVGTYQVKNNDVVLIQDNGGTGCPAQFYFLTVSIAGVKASSAFGNCSDLIEIGSAFDSVSVTMAGFILPFDFEATAEQRIVSKEKHLFVLKAGVLTDNGKLIK